MLAVDKVYDSDILVSEPKSTNKCKDDIEMADKNGKILLELLNTKGRDGVDESKVTKLSVRKR